MVDFLVSPDGFFAAYVADQDKNGVFELYVVFIDKTTGDTAVKVSGDIMAGNGISGLPSGEYMFDWTADSSRVAYIADQDEDDVAELYTSTPDARDNDIVSGELAPDGDVEDFKWAPDSSGVGYRADQDIDNVIELFASQPNGNENTKLSGTLVNGGDVFSFDWVP